MSTTARPRFADVLIFEVMGQRYGLLSPSVREVVRAVAVVPVPRAPWTIKGLIDVRGRVIPVLDLGIGRAVADRDVKVTDHFVLANVDNRVVALHADRVIDLVRIAYERIEQANDVAVGADSVLGVTKLEDGLVLICNLSAFLSRAEFAAFDDAVASHQHGPTG